MRRAPIVIALACLCTLAFAEDNVVQDQVRTEVLEALNELQ